MSVSFEDFTACMKLIHERIADEIFLINHGGVWSLCH